MDVGGVGEVVYAKDPFAVKQHERIDLGKTQFVGGIGGRSATQKERRHTRVKGVPLPGVRMKQQSLLEDRTTKFQRTGEEDKRATSSANPTDDERLFKAQEKREAARVKAVNAKENALIERAEKAEKKNRKLLAKKVSPPTKRSVAKVQVGPEDGGNVNRDAMSIELGNDDANVPEVQSLDSALGGGDGGEKGDVAMVSDAVQKKEDEDAKKKIDAEHKQKKIEKLMVQAKELDPNIGPKEEKAMRSEFKDMTFTQLRKEKRKLQKEAAKAEREAKKNDQTPMQVEDAPKNETPEPIPEPEAMDEGKKDELINQVLKDLKKLRPEMGAEAVTEEKKDLEDMSEKELRAKIKEIRAERKKGFRKDEEEEIKRRDDIAKEGAKEEKRLEAEAKKEEEAQEQFPKIRAARDKMLSELDELEPNAEKRKILKSQLENLSTDDHSKFLAEFKKITDRRLKEIDDEYADKMKAADRAAKESVRRKLEEDAVAIAKQQEALQKIAALQLGQARQARGARVKGPRKLGTRVRGKSVPGPAFHGVVGKRAPKSKQAPAKRKRASSTKKSKPPSKKRKKTQKKK